MSYYNGAQMKVLLENPFFVLDVPCDAPRATIEREAQKLLGMLELGFAAASTYATPLGSQDRTAELVRNAVATLRDPKARVVAEFWAANAHVLPAAGSEGNSAASAPDNAPAATSAARPARPPSLLQQCGWAARGNK